MANWAAPRCDAYREIPAAMASRLFGSCLRIIAMAAHAIGGGREKCPLAGMDGSIGTPLMPDESYHQHAVVFSW